jgi:hypothetical protein
LTGGNTKTLKNRQKTKVQANVPAMKRGGNLQCDIIVMIELLSLMNLTERRDQANRGPDVMQASQTLVLESRQKNHLRPKAD